MNDETGLSRLIAVLRAGPAPEAVFSLAATAQSLIALHPRPGAMLAAHAILMAVARATEGEPLDERAWTGLRTLVSALADYLEVPTQDRLDETGRAWCEWRAPPSLQ